MTSSNTRGSRELHRSTAALSVISVAKCIPDDPDDSVISLDTLVFNDTCSNDSLLVDIRQKCTSEEYININNEIHDSKQ